jgi:hypothetical protein
MSQDDDLFGAAEQQMRTLQAVRSRTQADLAEARVYGDPAAIGIELQALANTDQQIQALSNLAERHARSQQQAAPVPQNDQEWLSKAPEKMDYNDVARMAGKSKYGFDDASFRAGIEEVNRRRARGE